MTTSAINHTEKLQELLKHLRAKLKVAADGQPFLDDPTHQLVYSFLLWEASTAKADLAWKRVQSAVVDMNELRICLFDEIVAILGERYPRVEERAMRLRAALNDIYKREHAVTLEPLKKMNKREARQMVESLDGVPQYVSARVMLIGLGGHAVPIDERLLGALISVGALPEDATLEKGASILERQIKAADALEAHLVLQSWSEEFSPAVVNPAAVTGAAPTGATRSRSTGAARKTSTRSARGPRKKS
ncbi:MAG: hypothetical protein EA376_05650 [Phycisphaeraceae bacterium]|nr:MAG: hypothetical protein EA376_05650 [Phycisphaeraceae bacterium]